MAERDEGKLKSETEIRDAIARLREKSARSLGQSPEPQDTPREAGDREQNVQSGDPDLREELEAERRS